MTRVADVLYEYTEVLGVDEEPPVLTLTERQGFVPQGERFKKRLATEDTSHYKVVRRDDIAFNPYLLWAGALAQNTTCDRGIISPVYPTFRVREPFNARYVGHLLLSPGMIARYDTIAFGSVPRRRRSSVRDFLELEMPEPPSLEEQQRIAALLDTASAIRSTRTRTLNALDILIRSTFVDMFGDPVSSTAQPRKALGDVAEIVTGNTPSRRSTDNYGEHIEWLKSDNILTSGEVAPASEGLSKLGRRKGREAPAGATLVVCIAGSSKSIGRAGYLDRSAAFNQQSTRS